MKPQRWHGWRSRRYGPRNTIARMPLMFWRIEGRAMFWPWRGPFRAINRPMRRKAR
jgi:hypothetical protein